jgi:uncharacterized membrane protein YagU involved in acid resistance
VQVIDMEKMLLTAVVCGGDEGAPPPRTPARILLQLLAWVCEVEAVAKQHRIKCEVMSRHARRSVCLSVCLSVCVVYCVVSWNWHAYNQTVPARC